MFNTTPICILNFGITRQRIFDIDTYKKGTDTEKQTLFQVEIESKINIGLFRVQNFTIAVNAESNDFLDFGLIRKLIKFCKDWY